MKKNQRKYLLVFNYQMHHFCLKWRATVGNTVTEVGSKNILLRFLPPQSRVIVYKIVILWFGIVFICEKCGRFSTCGWTWKLERNALDKK